MFVCIHLFISRECSRSGWLMAGKSFWTYRFCCLCNVRAQIKINENVCWMLPFLVGMVAKSACGCWLSAAYIGDIQHSDIHQHLHYAVALGKQGARHKRQNPTNVENIVDICGETKCMHDRVCIMCVCVCEGECANARTIHFVWRACRYFSYSIHRLMYLYIQTYAKYIDSSQQTTLARLLLRVFRIIANWHIQWPIVKIIRNMHFKNE